MKYPNFFFERRLWKKGYKFIAGLDEVGRGSFAGPIIAGCVVFDKKIVIPGEIRIDDSKKVSPKKRETAAIWIKKNALGWGIGEIPATLINRIGIAKATRRAFRQAVSRARQKLGRPIDYLLIDAFFVPYIPGLPSAKRKRRQLPIIHGDCKSLTIGAASIIAKVYRDNLMIKLGKKPKLRKYAWAKNKGYGTGEHQKAILKYGITRYHRKIFVSTFLSKMKD
jgi:ribonuclease HII